MEVSQSHMDWVSASNTLDNSTMMLAADCDVASSGYYQRLLLDEDMFPPQSADAQVDHVNVLLNVDDMEHLDWERAPELNWEPSHHLSRVLVEELQCPLASQTIPIQFPTVDQSGESTETRGEDASGEEYQSAECGGECSYDQIDESTSRPVEHLDWVRAPKLNWEPSHHLPPVLVEELQCPLASQTIPIQFPTVDQSGESTETRGEDASGEEYQPAESAECGGECSYDQIDESTSRPVLASGEKIGVTYHRKNQQYEAHLWIKGPQLRGRKKKGVQIFLGNFGTEDEAKRAHDKAAIKLNIQPSARGKPYPLNFPAADHASFMEEHAHWTARDFLWKIRRTSNKFSKGKSSLKGVTVRKRSVKRGEEWAPKYEAKLSLTAKESGDDMKRTFMLGNFESEEEAGQAYDKALLFLHQHLPEVEQLRCITNYKPSSYSAADIEAMASKLSWQRSVAA